VLQKASDKALRVALIEYDRKRGYRGPSPISHTEGWKDKLIKLSKDITPQLLENQRVRHYQRAYR